MSYQFQWRRPTEEEVARAKGVLTVSAIAALVLLAAGGVTVWLYPEMLSYGSEWYWTPINGIERLLGFLFAFLLLPVAGDFLFVLGVATARRRSG